MDLGIFISGDFSEPGSPLLAGASEETLRPTIAIVATAANPRLAALKELGGSYQRAVVIDHTFDTDKGWTTSRQSYRRIPKPDATEQP